MPETKTMYDIVHAGEVAEHLENPQPAIDNWCKLVRGGVI